MTKKIIRAFVACLMFASIVAVLPARASEPFRAGFAVRTIVPDQATWPQIWHVARAHPTKVLPGDGLWARAAYLEHGTTKLAIVSVDLLGLFYDDIVIVRDLVRSVLGPDVQVLVVSTHTHSSPDALGVYGPDETTSGRNDMYNAFVVRQAAAAAIIAAGTAVDVTVRIASLPAPAGLNEYDRSRHPGTLDDNVNVIQMLAGTQTVGTIVNWASHPELIDPDRSQDPAIGPNQVVMSSDFVHTLRKTVEDSLGGTAVFINGPNGATTALSMPIIDPDTNTVFPRRSVKKSYYVGTRIGETALAALSGAEPVPDDAVFSVASKELFLPIDNLFLLALKTLGVIPRQTYTAGVPNPAGRDIKTEMMRIILGPLEVLTVPGEMQPDLYTGVYQPLDERANPDVPAERAIRPQMTGRYRFVAGLAMDELGYFVSATDYVWPSVLPLYSNGIDRNGIDHYQETLSLGRDEARSISQQASALLGRTPEANYVPYPGGVLGSDGTAIYEPGRTDVAGIWIDTSVSGRYEQREDTEVYLALPAGASGAWGFLDSQLGELATPDGAPEARGVWIDSDGDEAFDPARDIHVFFDTYILGEGALEPPV
jgi:hypothetical protein